MKVKFCHLIDGAGFNPLLYNSIKYSDREKFEYTVISLAPEGKLHEQMAELGVRSFSVNYASRKQFVSTFWKLYRIFRREKFQIVQTHLFDSSLIGLTAARAARVPLTIFTGHHSHEVPLYKRPFLTFVDGLSGRLLATRTIAPSPDMKEIFVKNQKIPPRRIEVIHHGFDLEKWRAQSREKNDLKRELGIENKIVFGAVGRLFWVKDFENLINAFAAAAEKRDDLALLIVGEGADREKLQNLINAKGLAKKAFLTGARTDIASVMNNFDVFVHSALAESFGMVFIEVCALGKPLISTRVGIAPDIIEDNVNGLLVAPERPEELARAMNEMLKRQKDWPQMGLINREIAEAFEIGKTQSLCDNFYFKWLNK
jgi:glycosyltransferase involved in cell wall biosynthesis